MLTHLRSFYEWRFTAILGGVILGLTLLAWANRFTQDDAFISYRYASNLVHGYGLVWNPGEPSVEGYTNFLWTLLIAGGIALRLEPVAAAAILGLTCFVVSLLFTYGIARIVFKSRGKSLLTLLLLGTNYSFSIYATGGLETQLQTSLLMAATCLLLRSLFLRRWTYPWLMVLSLVLAAAVLTRIDSAIIVGVVLAVSAFQIWKTRQTMAEVPLKLLALGLPLAILVGGWLVWKVQTYGSLLPNTFFVKVGSSISANRGGGYLYLFTLSYLLFPFVLLGAMGLIHLRQLQNRPILLLVVEAGLWLGYIGLIGGDFMEFRFLVPVLPLIFIFLVWTMFTVVQQPEIQMALAVLIVIGSIHHARTFGVFTNTSGILTVEELESPLTSKKLQWDVIGHVLGENFSPSSGVTVATTAAGIIPYYSQLRTIDMLGLNDAWVARNGIVLGDLPGHQRIAAARYLTDQHVTLVLGHPQVERRDELPQTTEYQVGNLIRFLLVVENPSDIPADTTVIEIPLDDQYRLVAVYLVKNPAVDAAIRVNHWQTYPVIASR